MGFSSLQMNSGSNIDYGKDSNKIPQKERFLSVMGFTLSELLLAAAILVFVLAGLLALFLNCMVLNEANRNLTVAMSHAQYILEQIKNTDFAQLESKINNRGWDLNASQIQSAPYNLPALSNESINTDVTQNGDPLGISVIVHWNDRGQRSRSVGLDTLVTDYQ